LWTRTDEPVFLEEERERELMEGGVGAADMGRSYEANTASAAAGGGGGDDDDFGPDLDDEEEGGGGRSNKGGVTVFGEGGGDLLAGGRATRGTLESLKGGERVMEALELADLESRALEEWEKGNRAALLLSSTTAQQLKASKSKKPANPLLLGLDPDRFVLRTLRTIKRPDLEEALLVLPFHLVERLVLRLGSLLRLGLDPELCTRVAVFVVRLHHSALAAAAAGGGGGGGGDDMSGGGKGPSMGVLLTELRDHCRLASGVARDAAGTNLAGLKLLKRSLEADDIATSALPDEALAAASGFSGRKPSTKSLEGGGGLGSSGFFGKPGPSGGTKQKKGSALKTHTKRKKGGN
jgi:U3 small nucleolar RNA-associated protein 12